jgi:hypothetical protein
VICRRNSSTSSPVVVAASSMNSLARRIRLSCRSRRYWASTGPRGNARRIARTSGEGGSMLGSDEVKSLRLPPGHDLATLDRLRVCHRTDVHTV